ncbi:MAG: cytochrome b [Alphaproteobacteria bacterium]|nr:cytochrome b [Alphaproteobacteria bacterium]
MRLRDAISLPDGRILRGRFDSLTILFHWTTVLAVLFLLLSGWSFDDLHHTPYYPPLVMVHRSLGLVVWGLTLTRFLWRHSLATFPRFPADLPTIVRWAAKGSEYALYGLLIVQPLTGLGHTLFTGKPFALFGVAIAPLAPHLPAVNEVFDTLHTLGGYGLAGLAGGHALAALFHHVVRKDDVLEAMLPWARRKRA